MPQVATEIRKERAARLRAKGQERLETFLTFHVKQSRQVIVEKDNYGHTEHFAPVRLDRAMEAGTMITVRTESVGDGFLNAVII